MRSSFAFYKFILHSDFRLLPISIDVRRAAVQNHFMLGLWVDLPWWIKAPASLAMMCIGGYLLWGARHTLSALDFGGAAAQHRDFFFGLVLFLLGLVLLVLSGRSPAEKSGYKF